jgi:hypothetical protein
VGHHTTNSASQEVVEVLSSLNQGSFNVVASPSHEGSRADASGSNGDNRSNNSSDELTESYSNSMKKATVNAAAATTDMTFDFGSSNIGKDQIPMMEGLSILPRGPPEPLT